MPIQRNKMFVFDFSGMAISNGNAVCNAFNAAFRNAGIKFTSGEKDPLTGRPKTQLITYAPDYISDSLNEIPVLLS